MKFLITSLILSACLVFGACVGKTEGKIASDSTIVLGDDCADVYLPLLQGKRVALFSNQTGINSEGIHILDALLAHHVNVTAIFSPEHGFRGTADAGEHVGSGVDEKTGVPILSLYDGDKSGPSEESMAKFDVLVADIQDVGLRFYTYYLTLLQLMDACSQHDKELVLMDRPNPNGHYVDGPLLDMELKSNVGGLPIPVVHGMTLGELAQMANAEGWVGHGEWTQTDGKWHLSDGCKQACRLTVVPCRNYTHHSFYELPLAPSPNLPNMKSIYLYASLCYFEATDVSLGRGTDKPFQVYGHPDMTGYDFSFTPVSRPGAKTPPQQDHLCYGVDLSEIPMDELRTKKIDLTYIVDAYQNLQIGDKFFTPFFEKLIGDRSIRLLIEQGKTADEVSATWQDGVKQFMEMRKPYLLYEE